MKPDAQTVLFEDLELRMREAGLDPSEEGAIWKARQAMEQRGIDAKKTLLRVCRGLAYEIGATVTVPEDTH